MSFLLVRALLFVLPVALWFAWWHWIGRRRRGERATPWAVLGICGCLLVLASLVGSTFFDGGEPGSTYRPTRVAADGETIPGGFEDAGPER